VCVLDFATHEIKREGTFHAVSSNIKVKHFGCIWFLSLFLKMPCFLDTGDSLFTVNDSGIVRHLFSSRLGWIY
jgi:hypothetical protein